MLSLFDGMVMEDCVSQERVSKIVDEIDKIEALPPACLPNPECSCETCERYCALFAQLEEEEMD